MMVTYHLFVYLFQLKVQEVLKKRERFHKEHEEIGNAM
jgi:hypothetical protein